MTRALAALVIVLTAAACGSPAAVSTTPTVSPVTALPSSAATPGCAWYTATSQPGQIVSVTARGPGCTDRTVIDQLVADTDRPWTTEAVIPGSYGHELATLTRNGTTITVWFTGPLPSHSGTTQTSPPAATLAGQLATMFEAARWTPVAPTAGTA
jgi:hypothetical protein